ncbi:hypothetical protein PAPYR_8507 [Paratrimastix pyriformis]|uniref:CULT domain-containing protein n=1 Tax=Paratrimastix pyriformis TaxID=342808 RepID=A0ABQ8UCZ6_9EUKA|nr:hypothetical protein PAPYR_8507 [Paratrimastix pyriformis]
MTFGPVRFRDRVLHFDAKAVDHQSEKAVRCACVQLLCRLWQVDDLPFVIPSHLMSSIGPTFSDSSLLTPVSQIDLNSRLVQWPPLPPSEAAFQPLFGDHPWTARCSACGLEWATRDELQVPLLVEGRRFYVMMDQSPHVPPNRPRLLATDPVPFSRTRAALLGGGGYPGLSDQPDPVCPALRCGQCGAEVGLQVDKEIPMGQDDDEEDEDSPLPRWYLLAEALTFVLEDPGGVASRRRILLGDITDRACIDDRGDADQADHPAARSESLLDEEGWTEADWGQGSQSGDEGIPLGGWRYPHKPHYGSGLTVNLAAEEDPAGSPQASPAGSPQSHTAPEGQAAQRTTAS